MDNKKVTSQSSSFSFSSSSSFSTSSNGNVTNTKMTRYSKSNINGNTKEEFEAFDNDKHMLMKKENGKVISQQVTKRDEKLLKK